MAGEMQLKNLFQAGSTPTVQNMMLIMHMAEELAGWVLVGFYHFGKACCKAQRPKGSLG